MGITNMIDLKQIEETLNIYVRPQSFPLAIRMCETEKSLPEGVRKPMRDLGIKVTLCQGLAMARRYGWTMAISKEDQVCPHALVVLGYVKNERYLDGSFAEEIGFLTKMEFQKIAKTLSFLEYGKYSHLLAAPIQKAKFEPHFILFYGNPAQVARLVQAATALSHGSLNFMAGEGIGCSVSVARTMLTDQCQVGLSGAGERSFALTQDHELAFTMPMSKVAAIMEGLEIGHKKMGHRYPTPSWLSFEGQLPSKYYKFTDLLLQEG